jgi:molecular chaperone IbpA
MSILTKYYTGNLEKFLNDIDRCTIGMDNWIKKIEVGNESNYPPYNIIKENETDYLVEIALAGFERENISVYTENGKLVVSGEKNKDTSDNREYVHHGIATREFTRGWSLPDDLEVTKVSFDNGLVSIKLVKILPENQKKKVWF